jgi:hypothetical protein
MFIANSFIFFLIKFILFYFIFFFLGRGLLLCISKFKNVDDLKVSGFNIYIFYASIGMVLFGNYLFLLNFFKPINSPLIFLIGIFLIPNIMVFPNWKMFKKSLRNFLLYFILLISSYDLAYHYDSGLYHLQFQALIRESNLIQGISNIYGPLGIGSIYDYISAALWFDTTYVLLQFLNLIFLILFYEFLLNLLFMKNNKALNNAGLAILAFSLLDNLGMNGGRNGFLYIQSLGKQDMTIAILYFVTTILIFINIKKQSLNIFEIIIPTIFALFIWELKVSGITIFMIYLVFLYQIIKKKLLTKSTKIVLFSNFTVGIFWTLKTTLQTGCLIYPLEMSCIDTLSWFNSDYTNTTLRSAQMYSIAYDFNSSLGDWFREFLEYQINGIILTNFIFSLFIIYFLFFQKKKNSYEKNTNYLIALITFNILFFFYYSPHLRYFVATQLIIIFIVGYKRVPRFNIKPKIIYFLVLFSIVSIVRINSYKSFDFFNNPIHPIPIPELLAYDDRFIPKEGDQCWAVTKCSANYNYYKIDKSNFFTVVTLTNEN